MEEWKDVIGYEGKYQVSNLGNVRSLDYMHTGNAKELKQDTNRYGYKIKESQLSKKIREYINLIGQDKLIELIKISKDKKEFYKLLNKNYND